MGPPIFIGGNEWERNESLRNSKLQWGRRFSSAEMTCISDRSIGRDSSFNGAADFHRRKCSAVVRAAMIRLASMGPPIFIGGNRAGLHFLLGGLKLLQWGRRFSSAEMPVNGVSSDPIGALQWGRRFSSAEIEYGLIEDGKVDWASMGPPIFIGGNGMKACTARDHTEGFNGAADFHRRKCSAYCRPE